jgi:primosomal protein N'
MKVPILIPNIFNHPFTYNSDLKLKMGDYVVVPFGKSELTGVVWDDFEKKTNTKRLSEAQHVSKNKLLISTNYLTE